MLFLLDDSFFYGVRNVISFLLSACFGGVVVACCCVKVLITNAPEITQVMSGFEGVLYSFFISSIIVGWLKK